MYYQLRSQIFEFSDLLLIYIHIFTLSLGEYTHSPQLAEFLLYLSTYMIHALPNASAD